MPGATLKQQLGIWLIPRLPVTRSLFDQVRLELNAASVRVKNRLLPRRRARLARLTGGQDLYVNLACGPAPLEGFVNLDLFASSDTVLEWDCRRGVPLLDRAALGIRVEHFFEHLDPREEAPFFLLDCRRALRPGGVLRIIVPDTEQYVRAYCSSDAGAFKALGVGTPFPGDLPTRMDILNHVFHQWHEHRWGYDFEALADRLSRAGFGRVERMAFGASLDATLAQDRREHAPYSLYVDAVR